jgi:hypothetical protein
MLRKSSGFHFVPCQGVLHWRGNFGSQLYEADLAGAKAQRAYAGYRFVNRFALGNPDHDAQATRQWLRTHWQRLGEYVADAAGHAYAAYGAYESAAVEHILFLGQVVPPIRNSGVETRQLTIHLPNLGDSSESPMA